MKLVPAFLFIIIAFTSCHFRGQTVRGDGHITTQDRNIRDFKGIDVSGNIDVVITQDSTFSVRVETDNNLQEFIEVYSSGDMLRIHPRDRFNPDPSRHTVVHVSGPGFDQLYASGACHIRSNSKITSPNKLFMDATGASGFDIDVNAPEVDLNLSGASSADLSGETKNLSIDGSGSTQVKAFDLMSETTYVQVSGASHAEVFASVKLDASGSGASHIVYKGNAAVNSSSSGASSVKKVD